MNTALPGLSPGAIAGITVGSIVVLGLIIGFFLLFFICKVLEAGTQVDMVRGLTGILQ